jgi:hypothetical protein
VKRTGGDEPFWVVLHIYMETTQGISLYSYLYLKLAKNAMFLLSSYVFSSTKLEHRRGFGTDRKGWWPGKGIGG